MKVFSDEAISAMEAGATIVAGAVKFDLPEPLRVWGGFGPLTIDGEDMLGVGDRGLVSTTGAALGGAEQNLTLQLSGVDPTVLAGFSAVAFRRIPAICWRLIFDGSGRTLLDATIFARGRVDQLPIEETPGGTATIKAVIEGAARASGRAGGRMRTDADQRLISNTDGGFKAVSYAGQVTLYWGGKVPVPANTALTSAPSSGTPMAGNNAPPQFFQ
jgi:hypothetical protein